MLKTMISTLALVLATSVAQAQSTGSQSATPARIAHAGGAPGTVGAMEAAAYGIATSPQDVVLQQSGRSVAADGARRLGNGTITGYSAGTVGATPGASR